MCRSLNEGNAAQPTIVLINERALEDVEKAFEERTPEACATALSRKFFRDDGAANFGVDEAMTQSVRMMLAAFVIAQPPTEG
jgi:hypothetical protein